MAVRSPVPQEGKLKSFSRQRPFASNIWFSRPHLFTIQRQSSPRPQTVKQEDGEPLFRPPCLAGLMPGTQGRCHTLWVSPSLVTGQTQTFFLVVVSSTVQPSPHMQLPELVQFQNCVSPPAFLLFHSLASSMLPDPLILLHSPQGKHC